MLQAVYGEQDLLFRTDPFRGFSRPEFLADFSVQFVQVRLIEPMTDVMDHPETDVRERILATTERLFREVGYQKTTVADIAKTLRMSPAMATGVSDRLWDRQYRRAG